MGHTVGRGIFKALRQAMAAMVVVVVVVVGRR
jgi:hypothetical protein